MSRRSRSKPLPKPPAQEFPDDEDIGDDEAEDLDEEQEITRCVCGNDELIQLQINSSLQTLLLNEYQIKIDLGLFIQCDKCSVWQHGYCVGLFINDDVPDKYWCEQCRPEYHIAVVDDARTLYKPVNEKRKVLINWSNDTSTHGKRRAGKSRTSASPTGAVGTDDSGDNHEHHSKHRKERRHFESGSYDEELEKALRESAKESGVPLSDIESRSTRKRRVKEEDDKSSGGASSPTKRKRHLQSDEEMARDGSLDDKTVDVKINIERATAEPDDRGDDEGEDEDDGEDSEEGDGEDETGNGEGRDKEDQEGAGVVGKSAEKEKPLASAGAGSVPTLSSSSTITATSTTTTKKKPGRGKGKATTTTTVTSKITAPAMTKEELINQPSKPRFVNSKSSIYELRKRTGAILEWLGRSQLELEEEKSSKVELFLYHEGGDKNDQQKVITNSYDNNLKLMEQLTEKILDWEQKFGKYAP